MKKDYYMGMTKQTHKVEGSTLPVSIRGPKSEWGTLVKYDYLPPRDNMHAREESYHIRRFKTEDNARKDIQNYPGGVLVRLIDGVWCPVK